MSSRAKSAGNFTGIDVLKLFNLFIVLLLMHIFIAFIIYI